MKRLTLALAILILSAAHAETILTTLFADGSTNSWTQADLITALQLMNRKYHREIQSHQGRTEWHGKIIRQEVLTNAAVKVDTYEDGFVWTNKWTAPAPATPSTAAAQAAAARQARAAALARQTNGVPRAVAAARQAAAAAPSATNITITINQ